MALPNVYTQAYGKLPEFFAKIQEGEAPASFTQQHLKDIGFGSSNSRPFIPLLKALGFLTPSGAPTSRYHSYRDKSQSRAILGEAIKEAYSDLFLIKSHPKESDKQLIEGKFKSSHNVTDRPAELMTRTFFSLLNMSDIDHKTKSISEPQKEQEQEKTQISEKAKETAVFEQKGIQGKASLHYNIQIHLPATKDIEVYNAIFKSLKEHLIG